MSAQTISDVFAPVEALYREQVQRATWGHLAPEAGRTYRGTILFAIGEYGDVVPVRVRFKGLPDSPWFFDAMIDFLIEQSRDGALKDGHIYRFSGTTCAANDDFDDIKFEGKVSRVRV